MFNSATSPEILIMECPKIVYLDIATLQSSIPCWPTRFWKELCRYLLLMRSLLRHVYIEYRAFKRQVHSRDSTYLSWMYLYVIHCYYLRLCTLLYTIFRILSRHLSHLCNLSIPRIPLQLLSPISTFFFCIIVRTVLTMSYYFARP